MNMMNKKLQQTGLILLAAIVALPVAVMADGPTSRPVRPPNTERNGDHGGGGEHSMRQFRQNAANRPPLTAEQWSDVLAFMHEHSPRRTEDLEKLLASAEERRANFLKQLIAAQFDYVTSLKNEDSELFDLQVSKIETQDAIYGVLRDKKGAAMKDDEKKSFHDLVAKLVDINLSERGRRIDRAKESLARAQTTLDEDMKHKDAMVDERMQQFIRDGAKPFKMDAPPARPDDAGATGDKVSNETFADGQPVMAKPNGAK